MTEPIKVEKTHTLPQQEWLHQLEALYSKSPMGIGYFDLHYRLVRANPTLSRMAGYTPEEVIGKTVTEISDYAAPVVTRALDEVITSGNAVRNVVITTRPPALGQGRVWTSDFFPVNNEGKVISVGIVAVDLTDQKRNENAILAAKNSAEAVSRSNTAFLANMSHEIRTPLTGIIGFASLLAQEANHEHRVFAEMIEQSGHRLMSTLNAILTLARLEAGHLVLAPEPVELVNEVRQVVHFFTRQAAEKGLDLVVDVQPDAEHLNLYMDRGALTSILQNLVSNAIKYTETGTVRVRVSVQNPDDSGTLRISVEDTGIGIGSVFLPRLFESFSQEPTTVVRPNQGTGLGLAITRQLVEKMHGRISVQSEKGRGSIFTVDFPLDDEHFARTHPVDREVPRGESGESARVLLVEDNPEAAFLARVLLQKVYHVTTACDAATALRLAGRSRYDLLFIDINLGPGPNGMELLSKLRSIPDYRGVPAAAITAFALPGDRERFIEAGFDGYLAKPFTAEALLGLASHLLRDQVR